MVKDSTSARSTYRESCIHSLRLSSITHQNDHYENLYATITHLVGFDNISVARSGLQIEFRMILSLACTLPASTTLPSAHPQTHILTITDRTMHHPSIYEPERLHVSLDRRRRVFVASKPKNSCFTWSITHPATTLTFSQADAFFLDDKLHSSSSLFCSCTQKIIAHSESCKMARQRD